MEPRIQYAKTKDGVSIAFWTLGEGMPLVVMPNVPFGHAQLEWQIPEYRDWFEQLAQKRLLVRYDGRGFGLSDWDVTDHSLDARVLDVEAVAARLGLERFALFAPLHSGPPGIAYAARHPEQVSHLVLWCAYARPPDYARSPQVQTLRLLIAQDWKLYTETVAHAVLGWSAGEPARQMAALMQECVTPEAAQAALGATVDFDAAPLLEHVKSPTLVMHRRQYPLMDVEVARRLASHIPNARLALLEGASLAPFLGDTEAVLAAIDEFLGPAANVQPVEPGAFRTILFTDVEGSTALTQRFGDAKAREVLREHERIVREALRAHGGSEVKTMGDGFMASFGSVTKAVECAVALQKATEALTPDPSPAAAGEGQSVGPLKTRCGLNAGEPIEEEGDLFGATVILASRIAARAEGGEILVADTVRGLCSGKGFLFADRGEFVAKGFEEPVRVYEVRWRE